MREGRNLLRPQLTGNAAILAALVKGQGPVIGLLRLKFLHLQVLEPDGLAAVDAL